MEKLNSDQLIKKYPISDVVLACYKEIEKDLNSRDRSWEHCYNAFQDRKNYSNIDYLSLHLGFYLASWGMMRGSTGLLWKDYKIHHELVKILIQSRWDDIRSTSMNDIDKSKIQIILDLHKEISKCLSCIEPTIFPATNKEVRVSPTDTLTTKILLGVFCNVPAYDTMLLFALEGFGIRKTFDNESLNQLFEFVFSIKNYPEFLSEKEKINKGGKNYPLMRIVDMYLWTVGDKLNLERY